MADVGSSAEAEAVPSSFDLSQGEKKHEKTF